MRLVGRACNDFFNDFFTTSLNSHVKRFRSLRVTCSRSMVMVSVGGSPGGGACSANRVLDTPSGVMRSVYVSAGIQFLAYWKVFQPFRGPQQYAATTPKAW